jgi:hypothetical protein
MLGIGLGCLLTSVWREAGVMSHAKTWTKAGTNLGGMEPHQ